MNDIQNAMKLTQQFTEHMTYQHFEKDEKTQYAVIRCLEVIGEAVKRVPITFRNNHLEIPWKTMAGMRDRLIHGYDVVDNEIIWLTIRKTIPKILRNISALIDLMEKS